MLSPEARRKLFELGVFAMPLVITQLAAMVLGSGAAVTEAADATEAPLSMPTIDAPDASWTAPQRAAAAYGAELAGRAFGPTPMFFQPAATPRGTPDPPPDAVRGEQTILVTAIVRIEGAAMALINGRPYRVDEVVVGGSWRVVAIDPEARAVRLASDETGEAITRSVPRP